jgi:SAM-dependent methyltransferase
MSEIDTEIDRGRPEDWWRDFFASPEWFDLHVGVDPAQAGTEAEGIINYLGVAPGGTILDVPCGPGRHALELAARGMRVVGVDITAALISEGSRRAAERGMPVSFECRDMRDLPWEGRFDGAFCYWGSFGYFDDAGNEAFVGAVARALKPGARFLVDTHCVESLLPKFQPRGWFEQGGSLVLEEREYDIDEGRVRSTWRMIRDGASMTRTISIRLYTFRELCELFHRAGFAAVEGFDTTSGKPFAFGSSRLTLVATKGS